MATISYFYGEMNLKVTTRSEIAFAVQRACGRFFSQGGEAFTFGIGDFDGNRLFVLVSKAHPLIFDYTREDMGEADPQVVEAYLTEMESADGFFFRDRDAPDDISVLE